MSIPILAASLIMVATMSTGLPASAEAPVSSEEHLPPVVIVPQVPRQPTSFELVQESFGEASLMMWNVFGCESRHRQFNADGTPLRSPTSDTGFTQVNDIWMSTAEELGLDYKHSLEDNIKMAKHIYDVQGIGAWTCAKKLGYAR